MGRICKFIVFIFLLLSDLGTPAKTLAQVPLEGLVAYFPFNGNADDESGNGNHGAVIGATLTTDRFGTPDQAFRFDGVADYILASADNLPTADRSVSLWFRADRLDNRPGLLGYGGGSCGTSWWMGINNGQADRQYQMQGHCLVNRIRSGYGPAPTGNWHHWLVKTDATGTTSYLDGTEVGANNIFINNTSVLGKDISLGTIPSSSGIAPFSDSNIGFFDGRIDEVAIYDRALELSEIHDIVDGNLPSDYLLFYPFSGNAADQSGNSNDGFVVGPSLVADRFGNSDSAYDFDGIDDYIVADADNLPTGERTVSLWFQADDLLSRPGLLGYGGGSCGTSWLMGINNGGADNQFQVTGHCNVNTLQTGYAPPPILSWHHLVITTEQAGTRIFADGVLLSSNDAYVVNTDVVDRDLVLGTIVGPNGLGPFADPNAGFFDGKLDDVYIYDRALSAGEIQVLFYDGDSSFIFADGFETGDVSRWQ